MEMLGKVRRMYLRDKLSLREITKRTGLSRNTIREWLRKPEEVQTAQPTYSRKDAACKLTAFHETLKQALKADAHRTKQNRRTVRALFAQIKVDGYSVPCELAGQRVSTRLYPTRIGVVANDGVAASHDRLSDRGQVCYDWQHYITLLERKPGALRNGAPFADMPAPLQRLRQGLMRHAGGDRIMAQVLAAVPTAGLHAVLVAVELVIESGALSAEHVLNVLARLNASPIPDCVATTLQLKEVPLADTARYDSLRGVDNVGEVTTASAVEADHA